MAAVNSFRDLEVWQESMSLVVQVYQVVKDFPKAEVYGLADQMKRAAVSVPSNIAEGWGRKYTQEYIKHVAIASGSLAELDTQLEIGKRLGFIREEQWESINKDMALLGRKLSSLRRSLSAK